MNGKKAASLQEQLDTMLEAPVGVEVSLRKRLQDCVDAMDVYTQRPPRKVDVAGHNYCGDGGGCCWP